MRTLSMGSRDPRVALLQRILNYSLTLSTPLREDHIFGPRTHAALLQFQRQTQWPQTGVVTPELWRDMGITLDIEHPVQLFPQPTDMSCWSAAATMLMGNMSVGAGRASVEPDGGLSIDSENVRTFAQGLGLQFHYPQSWTVQGLAQLLRRGPLWVGGYQPTGHAVVVAGMWSDEDPNGIFTSLLIYDPAPVRVGSIYPSFYSDRIANFPLMTMYILHR